MIHKGEKATGAMLQDGHMFKYIAYTGETGTPLRSIAPPI